MLSELGRNRNGSKIKSFLNLLNSYSLLFCIFRSWLAQIYAPDIFCASINSPTPLKHDPGAV